MESHYGEYDWGSEIIYGGPNLERRHLHVARWLAEDCGADIHRADSGGNSPLFAACHHGHLAVAQWLVDWWRGVERLTDSIHTMIVRDCPLL
jgi:hypothetical protein